MSERYPGGLITKTPVTPSGPYETSTASGIWTLDQQAYWQKLGQWPTAGNFPKDAQFNYVTMLLHGDGTNGAQNNTFLDSSTNNFTITRNGNTTQGSFSPYGSNWSNYFDGNGDYLLFADNAGLEIGTNSFTFEAWIYLTAYSSAYGSPAEYVATVGAKEGTNGSVSYRLVIVGTASSYTSLVWNTYSNDSTRVITSASYAFALNTWYHVAAVRNGTTVTLYVNGTSIGSGTDATNSQNTSAPFRVGSIGYTNYEYYFPGYISNLRLVNGTAVYTSNFTPPTAPLTAITNTGILTCQSNRFIDNSTNNAAVTVYGNSSVQRFNPFGASTAYSTSVIGGSGYFDGSGDYLATSSTQIIPASTTYTVEAWVYLTGDYSDYREIVTQGSSGNANRWLMFVNITDGILKIQTGSSSITTSFTVPKNTWTHLAFVNNGGSYTVYANGTSVGSGSNSVTPQNTYVTVGAFQSGAEYFQGYISNVRITNTAVYTSAFTPSTSPLTAISGTSLLLLMTNGAIFDNAMMNDLETVGNAQISTSVVKYGTGSLAFDGTGDWLTCPLGANLTIGASSDFTIECWFRANNFSTNVGCIYSSSNGNDYLAIRNSANLEWANGVIQLNYTIPSASTTTWYHLAVTRSGSTVRMFLAGSVVATGTDTSLILGLGSTFYIGNYAGNTSAGYSYNGYIDDFRITKGYARYTANFTPPTTAFPDIGPT